LEWNIKRKLETTTISAVLVESPINRKAQDCQDEDQKEQILEISSSISQPRGLRK